MLEVGRNARIDATIEPGGIAEVVSVVADAPLVEANSTSLSRTVGQNEVLNLPLVNRDVYSLLLLTPGVDTTGQASDSFGAPMQVTTGEGPVKPGQPSVTLTDPKTGETKTMPLNIPPPPAGTQQQPQQAPPKK